MSAAPGCEFPNPCPVCGSTDEHAEFRARANGMGCTFCPHPAQPGHGTGCCCAGRSKPLLAYSLTELGLPPSSPLPAARPTLEQRVAALEAGMKRLMLHLNLEPGFLQDCRVDVFHGGGTAFRLTHLPTGVTVDAPTKAEGVAKLAAALAASGAIIVNEGRRALRLPEWDIPEFDTAQPMPQA